MKVNGNGDVTALVSRIARVEGELNIEKHKRLMAEQKAAGLRSAVVRMPAMLAKCAVKPSVRA